MKLKLFKKFLDKIKTLVLNPPTNIATEFDELCDDHDLKSNEFYFNRDPFVFKMIFHFYTHGLLHIDDKSCISLIDEELKYWEIDPNLLSNCCREKFFSKRDTLDEQLKNEREIIEKHNKKEDFGKYFPKQREKLWILMENPGISIMSIVIFLILNLQILCPIKALYQRFITRVALFY